MNALVQIAETPQMSYCAICPAPGACCRRFTLSSEWSGTFSFPLENWRETASAEMRERGLPFEAFEVAQHFQDLAGRERVTLLYRCPKVTAEGRCSIYEFRPETCRSYVPGTEGLCVFTSK